MFDDFLHQLKDRDRETTAQRVDTSASLSFGLSGAENYHNQAKLLHNLTNFKYKILLRTAVKPANYGI